MTATRIESKLERTKAKRLLYGILSVLWVFPSVGAFWIVQANKRAQGITVELWVAFALLAVHVMWIVLALQHYFRLRRLAQVENDAARDHTTVGTS
jgi:O-antigen ligase